ncbi:MAG: indolepyruvate ferredoxin oxidoreductase subunit alpha [Deltaproteobacteria bacterium]|nr:indolepyruvate ferredoxin oxidoreductase subunit alpha [Deltaproteobacteria bacterium]
MHPLLQENPDKKILVLGNEAIARGAIEAGVAFATTYPGTPSSEISENLFKISQQTDLYFEYSVNEKVALEVAAAAANSGLKTLCIMKHVGLNVAADPLMTLAYVGVTGSLVILTADDPFMFSSQNEQDNRFYGKLSGLPVLEPSSVQEAKDMLIYAFALSEKLKEPVIFRTTTRINHSSAFITLGEIQERKTTGDFKKDPLSYVTVPAVSRNLHLKLLKNIEQAESISENCGYNFQKGDGELGIITSGVSFLYASDAVEELNIADKVKILKIGFSNPLPQKKIRNFLKDCKKVLIIEEGELVLETYIKACAQQVGITIAINGKGENLFKREFEFDPETVKKVISSYFGFDYTPKPRLDLSNIPELPMRPPNLCSGCSHRATFYEVKKAAQSLKLDAIYPNDIGCYTLGFMPPLSMGDFVICMGSSVSSSCGFSKAIPDKKVVGYIGDSTFFHSGITGLINAVFNNHNITLVILDNGTTAMTGHQPNPGVDMKQLGLEQYQRVSIENIVKAAGVKHVTVIKPKKVKKSIEAIKEALSYKGVSVIISQELCVLYAKALKMPKGRPFYITDKCKDDRDCINEIACPSFYIDENNKVKINADTCIGCTLCAQICPENAIMPVPKS